MDSGKREVCLAIHHANTLNGHHRSQCKQTRKRGCGLRKPPNSWLWPEGQPHSSSTPPLGQSSSDVKPHLEAVVNTVPAAQPKSPLLLTAVVWPRSRSLSRANADPHAASPTRSQRWEPAGLKWALAYSKTSTGANIHEEKEWKCLFWQPCGMQPLQHQPASQSSLLPYPVQPC